jgi:type IV pilus assembly protein PilP
VKRARIALLLAPVLALSGCGMGGDFSDLRAYMDEVRAREPRPIEKDPEVLEYEPFTYKASALRSPFQAPVRMVEAERQTGSRDVAPDETRVRQFLEGFNIELFEMVGTLSNQDGLYALVSGADGVHRVKVGDYLGRNHGRIQSISDAQIDVVEIVPDGEGGWIERPRSISLKERS